MDDDHGGPDGVDDDLIEGDIEQGARSKALQDSNGQKVASTRLQCCFQIKNSFFNFFSVKFLFKKKVLYPHLLHVGCHQNPNNHSNRTEEAAKSSNMKALFVHHYSTQKIAWKPV